MSNNSTTRKEKLPVSFGRAYWGERVFGIQNKELVAEERARLYPDTDSIKSWNKARHKLWKKLSADEQEEYDTVAEEWTLAGPTDAQKLECVFFLPFR